MATPNTTSAAPTPPVEIGNPQDAKGLYRKEIRFNRESGMFDMFLDGELIGDAIDNQAAETALDLLVFELLSGQYFREAQA